MDYKNIKLKWGGHSGFLIEGENKKIYIDPFKLGEEAFSFKADMILITHSHYDHFSVEDIKRIIKHGTKIIGPPEIISQTRQVRDGIDFIIVEPNKSLDIDGIKIATIPMYNLNKAFHPKDEGNVGYLVDIGGTRIYHSGDSDFIPEMNRISTDIALLPISGKFTMDSSEAINAARSIKPKLAIPMHWGSIIGSKSDAEKFVSGCKSFGIDSITLEKEI